MKTAEIVRKLREETEYQEFFKKAMQKFNISSPGDLKDPAKKKEFFNYIDKNYKAKVEGVTAGGMYPVHSSANKELKRAVAMLNNFIKNSNIPKSDLLVELILDVVEAEIRQEAEDRGSELGIDL